MSAALRHALPGMAIQVRIKLPATQRSCDMVLETRVYVEVLGMAQADMPKAGNRRKQVYAQQ